MDKKRLEKQLSTQENEKSMKVLDTKSSSMSKEGFSTQRNFHDSKHRSNSELSSLNNQRTLSTPMLSMIKNPAKSTITKFTPGIT